MQLQSSIRLTYNGCAWHKGKKKVHRFMSGVDYAFSLTCHASSIWLIQKASSFFPLFPAHSILYHTLEHSVHLSVFLVYISLALWTCPSKGSHPGPAFCVALHDLAGEEFPLNLSIPSRGKGRSGRLWAQARDHKSENVETCKILEGSSCGTVKGSLCSG